jgi:hypothetical protein
VLSSASPAPRAHAASRRACARSRSAAISARVGSSCRRKSTPISAAVADDGRDARAVAALQAEHGDLPIDHPVGLPAEDHAAVGQLLAPIHRLRAPPDAPRRAGLLEPGGGDARDVDHPIGDGARVVGGGRRRGGAHVAAERSERGAGRGSAVRVVEVDEHRGGRGARGARDPVAQDVDPGRLDPQRVDPDDQCALAVGLERERGRLEVAGRPAGGRVAAHEADHREPQRRLEADRGRAGREGPHGRGTR